MAILLLVVIYKYSKLPATAPPCALCLLPSSAAKIYVLTDVTATTATLAYIDGQACSNATAANPINGANVLMVLSNVSPFLAQITSCTASSTGALTFNYIPSVVVDLSNLDTSAMMMIMV